MKAKFKETYFMAAKCYKANYLEGFVTANTVMTVEDNKPIDSKETFESMLIKFNKNFEDKGLDIDNVEVTAFNRV